MNFQLSEQKHHYGQNVHLLQDPYLNQILYRLSLPETVQPLINQYVEMLYSGLIRSVINNEFPIKLIEAPTRMTEKHKDKPLKAFVLDQKQQVVVVNLARAGTLPSYVCYKRLNYLMDPARVRQDHIMAARKTNSEGVVEGTEFGASKIGGSIEGAIVLFPDPMGATGGTIVSADQYYKEAGYGSAKKTIALHLIVTPEYLKKIKEEAPHVKVYAIRLDRGLSSPNVLNSELGEFWESEVGLDDQQYIVPGAGGLGEILNNSFV